MFHVKNQARPFMKSASFGGNSSIIKRSLHVGSASFNKGAVAVKNPTMTFQDFSKQILLGYAEDAYHGEFKETKTSSRRDSLKVQSRPVTPLDTMMMKMWLTSPPMSIRSSIVAFDNAFRLEISDIFVGGQDCYKGVLHSKGNQVEASISQSKLTRSVSIL